MVGPWILWKIRHIKDVHSWAWQTRLAIIAGYVLILQSYLQPLTEYSLPGTPLWIAFTYSQMPEMSHIKAYFPPPGW
jgi:hypothetical protein